MHAIGAESRQELRQGDFRLWQWADSLPIRAASYDPDVTSRILSDFESSRLLYAPQHEQ
jgi:hypothetical protein